MTVSNAFSVAEVIYVTADGELFIRHMASNISSICNHARTCKALYVLIKGVYKYVGVEPDSCWEVFDARRIERDNPHPGAYSLPLPSKTFPADQKDAALMWAHMHKGRR